MIPIIISAAVFTLYVLFILLKYGLLESVSASHKKLPINQGKLFTFALWGFAWPLVFVDQNVLLFLGVAGITLVGVAPEYYNDKIENRVHGAAAFFGAASGLASLWVFHGIWWPVPLLAIIWAILYLFKSRYIIYVLELVAFYSILAGYVQVV